MTREPTSRSSSRKPSPQRSPGAGRKKSLPRKKSPDSSPRKKFSPRRSKDLGQILTVSPRLDDLRQEGSVTPESDIVGPMSLTPRSDDFGLSSISPVSSNLEPLNVTPASDDGGAGVAPPRRTVDLSRMAFPPTRLEDLTLPDIIQRNGSMVPRLNSMDSEALGIRKRSPVPSWKPQVRLLIKHGKRR